MLELKVAADSSIIECFQEKLFLGVTNGVKWAVSSHIYRFNDIAGFWPHLQLECNPQPTQARVCFSNHKRDNYPVLDKRYWSVYVGSKCSRIELCQNAFKVSKVVVYKHFDYCEKVNDMALMELASDVPDSSGIPICMPDKNMPLSKTIKADGSGMDRKTIFIKCAHIIAPSNSLINMGLFMP
uniref:DUF1899 domain-containing protein n=1 Tax=Angiostrongylus cantonensis TaxID=6313 RepID=A0A0K0D4K4_ANGCA